MTDDDFRRVNTRRCHLIEKKHHAAVELAPDEAAELEDLTRRVWEHMNEWHERAIETIDDQEARLDALKARVLERRHPKGPDHA